MPTYTDWALILDCPSSLFHPEPGQLDLPFKLLPVTEVLREQVMLQLGHVCVCRRRSVVCQRCVSTFDLSLTEIELHDGRRCILLVLLHIEVGHLFACRIVEADGVAYLWTRQWNHCSRIAV